jgi:hypothetical protein
MSKDLERHRGSTYPRYTPSGDVELFAGTQVSILAKPVEIERIHLHIARIIRECSKIADEQKLPIVLTWPSTNYAYQKLTIHPGNRVFAEG